MIDETQAAAILRRAGVYWPHVSRADIDALLSRGATAEAIKTLLATVPDDDEIEVVTKTDKDGNTPETKKIANPKPMYKRLGFFALSDIRQYTSDPMNGVQKTLKTTR